MHAYQHNTPEFVHYHQNSNPYMFSSMIRLSVPFTFNPNYYFNRHFPSSSFRLGSSKIYNSDAKEFDESAFEAERLRLDAKARESMAQTSKRAMEAIAEEKEEEDPKAWKWVIRKRVWDLMEAQNIAQNPRPVHHRIPNFVGASAAAKNVKVLDFWAFSVLLS